MKKNRILSVILSALLILTVVLQAGVFAEETEAIEVEPVVEEVVFELGGDEDIEEAEDVIEEEAELPIEIVEEEAALDLEAIEDFDETVEEEELPFVEGYVRVNGEAVVYETEEKETEVGFFAGDAVAFAVVVSTDENGTPDWLWITFDTVEAREAGEALLSGYVPFADVTVMSEESVDELVEALLYDDATRAFDDYLLPAEDFQAAEAAGDLVIEEQEEVVEEVAGEEEAEETEEEAEETEEEAEETEEEAEETEEEAEETEEAEEEAEKTEEETEETEEEAEETEEEAEKTEEETEETEEEAEETEEEAEKTEDEVVDEEEEAEAAEEEASDASTAAKITKQPADVTAPVNSEVKFTVTATNAETYTWQYSNTNGAKWGNCGTLYAGRDTNTLTVKASSARNGWMFRCVVTGGGATVQSNPATLTVNNGPEITQQPASVSAAVGDTVTFSVAATGVETYAWQYSNTNGEKWGNCGTLYAGRDTDTLSFKASTGRDGWMFRCVLTGGGVTMYTDPAVLTIGNGPKIINQPEDVTAAANTTVTFSVTATNAESYQWQYSNTNGEKWGNCGTLYAGRDTDTVTVKATTARDGWMFRCVVTGGGEKVESDPATLTIGNGPKITKQPEDVTTAANTYVTFSVTATNADSYQWQYSNTNGAKWGNCGTLYSGRDTDTVKVYASSARDGWMFRCLVTGNGETIESDPATLTISKGPEILVHPEDVTAQVNTLVTFSVTATNADSYQWQYSNTNGAKWGNCGTLYSGRDTDTVKVNASAARDGWMFRCVVTGGGVTVESDPATLTVNSNIVIDDVTYEPLTSTTCKVASYAGTAATLVIPETVEGMTVTEIGEEAFMDNKYLTSIDLPDTITVIRARAFKNCTKLSNMY